MALGPACDAVARGALLSWLAMGGDVGVSNGTLAVLTA
jgi:hypothetical protein